MNNSNHAYEAWLLPEPVQSLGMVCTRAPKRNFTMGTKTCTGPPSF